MPPADPPANLAVIDDFFHKQDGWSTVFRRGNLRFAQREDSMNGAGMLQQKQGEIEI